METFEEKLQLVHSLFKESLQEEVEDKVPMQVGTYYGGLHKGRKYMYSKLMIETLTKEKLEKVIRKQTNI